jgi:hypothetical protein
MLFAMGFKGSIRRLLYARMYSTVTDHDDPGTTSRSYNSQRKDLCSEAPLCNALYRAASGSRIVPKVNKAGLYAPAYATAVTA